MGLGKTVQTLALICANPPGPGDPKTTIVVAPVSVMATWSYHIAKYINGGKKSSARLRVAKFHGPKRHGLLRKLEKQDIIDVLIVSYDTLVSEKKKFEKRANNDEISSEEESEEVEADSEYKEENYYHWDNEDDLSIFDLKYHRIVLDEGKYCFSNFLFGSSTTSFT